MKKFNWFFSLFLLVSFYCEISLAGNTSSRKKNTEEKSAHSKKQSATKSKATKPDFIAVGEEYKHPASMETVEKFISGRMDTLTDYELSLLYQGKK